MRPLNRLFSLFRRRQLDAEMAEEMRAHLEMQAERNRAAGMSADDARDAALRQFGNVASVQERVREARGWTWLELAMKEIGFAIRSLRRAPGFSLAVLATLALCIGPNTAILSVLHALVLKPLPFPESERLVSIVNVAPKSGSAKRQSSVAQYLDFKAHADFFEGFAYLNSKNVNIGNDDSPFRGAGLEVSADFFSNLGIRPQLGRFFQPEEQTPGNEHVVMLTNSAWLKRYNADPRVIGREMRMDDEPYTIVGVAPASFDELFTDAEFFRPYAIRPEEANPEARYAGSVRLLGRLRPGVSLAAGEAQLDVLERSFQENYRTAQLGSFWNPADAGGYRIAVTDARQELAEPVRAPLLLLQGGAALVLLIGCVNVASLLLARANAKRPELAVRHALGAGRATLLRQMLAESFLLVGVAGVGGVGIALGMLRFMNHHLPTVVRHVPPVALNTQVLGLVLVVIGAMILAMALVPFALTWRSGLRIGETPTASANRRSRHVLSALVLGQMAVALVLLIGAGLLIHSFARVMAVNPGFDAAQVVQGRVNLPVVRYKAPLSRIDMQQRILAAMKEVPGVEATSLSLDFGVAESFRTMPFFLRGNAAAPADAPQPLVYLNVVSPEYFATMGIRLHDGRVFRDDDSLQRDPVAIVDQAFAERYFPGQSAVGQELTFGAGSPPAGRPWIRIIGVVARANLTGLEARDGWPFVYLPCNQQPSQSFSVLLRSARLESDIVSEMRARLRSIDPGLPLFSTGSLAGGLDSMLGRRRALMFLLGVFAALALLLAAVGLYGVLNYDVAQRTREIGIRGAIGATREQIVAMILRQGLMKAGAGLAIGLVGAFFFTRVLRKMLFDVSPIDPVAYGVVVALLLLVALAASWLPARRAAKVDPVIALRAE